MQFVFKKAALFRDFVEKYMFLGSVHENRIFIRRSQFFVCFCVLRTVVEAQRGTTKTKPILSPQLYVGSEVQVYIFLLGRGKIDTTTRSNTRGLVLSLLLLPFCYFF